ncbi:MATH and LRR domain-containing protein PFE0570w-like isoform X2, partial [Aphis craccivora]
MNTHASFNESDESIECCKSNIKLIVDMITFGKGTLYVTESKLYWKNNANSQVISINYDIMCKYNVSHYPGRHKKSCLKMIVDYNYKPDEFNLNEDEEEEKFKSIIKLVPDNPECLDAIFEAIARIQPLHLSDNVVDEKNESDEHEHSDKKSNTSITSTCTEEDQELGSIDISDQYHKLDEKNGETGNQ